MQKRTFHFTYLEQFTLQILNYDKRRFKTNCRDFTCIGKVPN